MSDIFISYSRKDSQKALALAEYLRDAGISVWIDQHGIEAATSWSKEIVEAIESSHVFIILLSPASLLSENVVKELSIASEARRVILPIGLEAVTIPSEFKYHLAGLQRAEYSDFDSIMRALLKIGIVPGSEVPRAGAKSTGGQGSPQSNPRRSGILILALTIVVLTLGVGSYFLFFARNKTTYNTAVKTVAVLPFESLSSDKANEYFADGMTGTLIDMLAPIPELRVIDRQTVKEFKATKQDLKSVAQSLGVRYIVDGTIQREGNALKIEAEMTDAHTGKILVSKSFEGKTDDLIQMQEQIAKSIVVELELAFNGDEILFPSYAATSVPEAYDLCLKADYFESHDQMDSSVFYYLRAAKLDTTFAFPYLSIAREFGNAYSNPRHSDSLLSRADSFFAIGKRLDTAHEYSHFVASWLASVHGNFDGAIKEAMVYEAKRPDDYRAYRVLGLAYARSGRHDLAANNFIEDLRRNPTDSHDMFMLLCSLWSACDTVRLREYSNQAIQLFEAHLIRQPEDASVINNSLPLALVFAGRGDEACKRMDELLRTPNCDPKYILNAAAINSLSQKPLQAMKLMQRFIDKQGILAVDFERPFFDNLRSMPEFQALVKKKEEKSRKHV